MIDDTAELGGPGSQIMRKAMWLDNTARWCEMMADGHVRRVNEMEERRLAQEAIDANRQREKDFLDNLYRVRA